MPGLFLHIWPFLKITAPKSTLNKFEMISYLNVKESIWQELILPEVEKPVLSSRKSPSPLCKPGGYLRQ